MEERILTKPKNCTSVVNDWLIIVPKRCSVVLEFEICLAGFKFESGRALSLNNQNFTRLIRAFKEYLKRDGVSLN